MSRLHLEIPSRAWARVRRQVLDRDGWRCQLCGKAGRLEVDHVVPLRRGGEPLDPRNLRTLCRGCHIAKTRLDNRKPRTAAELRWAVLVDELR